MKASVSILATAMGIMACSTQRPSPSPPAAPPTVHVQVSFFNVQPAPEYPAEGPGFSVCKLGSSCLALDPRPFELCLLGTSHCSDKIVEPLLVGESFTVLPAHEIEPEPVR